MSSSWVYQLINPWQGEAILWAIFVQVCEINAHPPFSIAFFLPLPCFLANLGGRLPWWSQLLIASLLLQLQFCCALVQIFSTSDVQVCILSWRWDDAIWSSYQFRAYPCVSRRKHLGLPSRRKPSSLSPKLGVLILSIPMYGSPQMLRQFGSTLLQELDLLWFLLLYRLLEISLSSNMLTLLQLACWVQVFRRWCYMLKGSQLWGNQFPWWPVLGKCLQLWLEWRCP